MNVHEQIEAIFPEEIKIPSEFALGVPVEQTEYLINGELRQWVGSVEEVYSPIYIQTPSGLSPKRLGSYPLLTEKESLEVLDAAVQAYDNGRGRWPTMSVGERIQCVETFVQAMKEKRSEVVNLLMWEIAKPRSAAEKEFDRTVEYIQNTMDTLQDMDRAASKFVIEQDVVGQIRRAPLGVVLCMGPPNYPLNETFTLLIPALIMGNVVILKPRNMGILLHRPLLEAFQHAFPPGVMNTLYGKGETVVEPLMTSGKIDVLAFIGSSGLADRLKNQHPKPHRLRSVLGLEAKNAAIILPDADLDLTVKECIAGALSYNGQRCTALKILFIHEQIVDTFLEKITDAIGQLKFGMPWEDGVSITPMPTVETVKYLTDLIKDAQQHGARILNEAGGTVNRTFLYPTVLYPVNTDMQVAIDEQFGPVVPIHVFDDIEIPIRYITDLNYGQQVSIFGNNTDGLANLIDPLVNQVCRVNINSQCQRGPDTFPFTGRKDSAEGTLSVGDALEAFSIPTMVAAKGLDTNGEIITRIAKENKSRFLTTDLSNRDR